MASCYSCGHTFGENEERRADRHGDDYCLLCANNFYECRNCGDVFHPRHEDYMNTVDGYVCSSCAYDYVGCYECGDMIHVDNVYYDNRDNYLCEHCHDNQCSDRTIRGYHDTYKCAKFFSSHHEDDPKLFVGIELEVENKHRDWDEKNDDASFINDMFPDNAIYFEEDGSLRDGYEIITAPMSHRWFTENHSTFAKMLASLRSKRYSSHNNGRCGLHIHVSRAGFGDPDAPDAVESEDLAITKAILIFEKFFDDIVVLSRRSQSTCSQWAGKYSCPTDEKYIDENIVKANKYNLSRYRAVNLTPENTVEFRIFRGSLADSSFFGAVEFVVGVVNAANTISTEDIHNADSLRQVLNPNTGSELDKFLSRYNL